MNAVKINAILDVKHHDEPVRSLIEAIEPRPDGGINLKVRETVKADDVALSLTRASYPATVTGYGRYVHVIG